MRSKKIAILIIAILIFTLSLGAVAFANDNFRSLYAWFGNISIFRNNQQVYLSAEPFIVDGVTYVPLRAIAELFDKDVGWDGVDYRIDLNDKPVKPDEDVVKITQQLLEAQVKSIELEAKVKELEAKLKEKEEATVKEDDLKKLETSLNKKHNTGSYKNFDISLYKKNDTIEVDIYGDLGYDPYYDRYYDDYYYDRYYDDYYYGWGNLSESSIKSYIRKVVDDITAEFKDVNIEGYITDRYYSSSSRTVATFSKKKNGSLSIDTNYNWDYNRDYNRDYYSLSDIQYDLNKNYNNHKGVYFDIKLRETSGYGIEVDINTTSSYTLRDLSDYEVRSYLNTIYDKIVRDYRYTDIYRYDNIYGYVRDSYSTTQYKFDYYKGYLDLVSY